MKIDSRTKKIGGRVILAVLYVTLIVIFFLTGRAHTILIDNKADPDGNWQAIRAMNVTINNGAPTEYMKGDRDKEIIKGQKFSIIVEFFDGREPFKATLSVPLVQDTVLLSIPKLIEGITPAMDPFDIYGANRATTDSTDSERFGQEDVVP